ncbi:methyltransferase family protein [Nonomuraea sp. SYSU D8015]|uniref:methyltransferase family protein n=1 Tax=Nonomuraea sp. SYSU D8015 TaxID=2593644 RepID=UPI0016612910|nr:hypothetical protein [Nonomuraea sp. SYSU D8015]
MTAAPQTADTVEPAPANKQHHQAIQVILDNLPGYAALYTLCDLRIPDRLARSAASVDELAEWTASTMLAADLSRDYLRRVLRAAHAYRYVRLNPDGTYQLTDVGRTLRTGIPHSAHTAVMRAALRRRRPVRDAATVRRLPRPDDRHPEEPIAASLHRLDLYEALYLLCALRIPDHLDGAPATLDELLAWCRHVCGEEGSGLDLSVQDLVILLHIAHAQRWLYRTPGGAYRQTEIGHLLTSSAAASMRPAVMTYALPPWWKPLATMDQTVRTGTPAALAGDRTLNELMADQPESAFQTVRAFRAWQSATLAPFIADAITAHTDNVRTVITIGGGPILLAEILNRHRRVDGVLVGRGRDADAAANQLARIADYPGRWGVPHGAGVRAGIPIRFRPLYVMPNLICHLDDRDGRELLAGVAAAMDASGPDSILWLVETVMPENVGPHPSIAVDLLEMTRTRGGRARTIAEYAALLRKAGLRISGDIAAGPQTIIAAHTARDQPPPMDEQRLLATVASNVPLPDC